MQAGKSSIQFEHPPIITSAASIVGQTEGEGPLASFFDRVEPDPTFGKKSWEEAESELQRQTVQKCLDKAGRQAADVNCMFAGDLFGQIVATSFGVESFDIPFFGLYGACSTMGEAMILGAMAAGAGYADRVLALASSHFASAERQFRYRGRPSQDPCSPPSPAATPRVFSVLPDRRLSRMPSFQPPRCAVFR